MCTLSSPAGVVCMAGAIVDGYFTTFYLPMVACASWPSDASSQSLALWGNTQYFDSARYDCDYSVSSALLSSSSSSPISNPSSTVPAHANYISFSPSHCNLVSISTSLFQPNRSCYNSATRGITVVDGSVVSVKVVEDHCSLPPSLNIPCHNTPCHNTPYHSTVPPHTLIMQGNNGVQDCYCTMSQSLACWKITANGMGVNCGNVLTQYPIFATSTCFSVLLVAACTTMAIFSGLVSTYSPNPSDDGLTTFVPEGEKLVGENDGRTVNETGNCCRSTKFITVPVLSICCNIIADNVSTQPLNPPTHQPTHSSLSHSHSIYPPNPISL